MALHRRMLTEYPVGVARWRHLALAVALTITLAWEATVSGSVAPQIISQFQMSFAHYVSITIISIAVGALGALAAGLGDRFGRTPIVLVGLPVISLLNIFAIPATHNSTQYLVVSAIISVLEGATAVALPALVRDFSPQMQRATALAMWSVGPVLGELLVTGVASKTLDATTSWHVEFRICGIAGLVVSLVALGFLRELSPSLRQQVIVRDETEALPSKSRSALTMRLTIAALGVSIYMMFYYVMVGFFAVFIETTWLYKPHQANALANWYWAATAISMIASGVLSDRLRARKLAMVVGCAISAGGAITMGLLANHSAPAYSTLVWVVVICAIGNGIVFPNWFAAFTETIDDYDASATAKGLALSGTINKVVITAVLLTFMAVVTAPTILIDEGGKMAAITKTYAVPLYLAQHGDPAAAAKVPPQDLAYLAQHLPRVTHAAADGGRQWRTWWLICAGAQVLFLFTISALVGYWRPRRSQTPDRAAVDVGVVGVEG